MSKELKIINDTQYKNWVTDIKERIRGSQLKAEFPAIHGFSVTNLKYMKRFYLFYQDKVNRQQPVDDLQQLFSIPWGHQILLFTKCKSFEKAVF
jgi:hypothetical protein